MATLIRTCRASVESRLVGLYINPLTPYNGGIFMILTTGVPSTFFALYPIEPALHMHNVFYDRDIYLAS